MVTLCSLTNGAPSAMDSSRLRTTGSNSYSTSMAATAAAASALVDAATAASAWPTYSTTPRAMRFSATSRSGLDASSSGKSALVTTAFTPGIASAAVVSMDRTRAWP